MDKFKRLIISCIISTRNWKEKKCPQSFGHLDQKWRNLWRTIMKFWDFVLKSAVAWAKIASSWISLHNADREAATSRKDLNLFQYNGRNLYGQLTSSNFYQIFLWFLLLLRKYIPLEDKTSFLEQCSEFFFGQWHFVLPPSRSLCLLFGGKISVGKSNRQVVFVYINYRF